MRRTTASLVLALCCLTPTAAATGNWPGFKGTGSGIADGAAPTSWDAERGVNVAWKTPIPGIGHSSPVVWGRQLFVTTAVAADGPAYPVGLNDDINSAQDDRAYAWRVVSLDTETGSVRWERTLHEGRPRAKRHGKNSYATPTPTTDGRRLVVFFGSEGLYCLDLEGRLLWKRDLGVLEVGFYQDPTYQWGIATSPVLYRNLVLLQLDLDRGSALTAFDLETGEVAWRTPRADGQSWSTPVVYSGPAGDVIVTNAKSHVRAYDPLTGGELWQLRWNMDIVLSSPTVVGGLIYTASGKGDNQPIIAIRPTARGELAVGDRAAVAWYRRNGGAIVTSPLAYRDCLYALVDLGVLRCMSVASGEMKYQERVPASFLASPVAADGKIYLTAEDGDVYVVRAGTTYELLAVNPMGEPCVATPAFAHGRLYVRTIGHVVAIDDRSGA